MQLKNCDVRQCRLYMLSTFHTNLVSKLGRICLESNKVSSCYKSGNRLKSLIKARSLMITAARRYKKLILGQKPIVLATVALRFWFHLFYSFFTYFSNDFCFINYSIWYEFCVSYKKIMFTIFFYETYFIYIC